MGNKFAQIVERKYLNILIVSQYFWPESFMINDLVLKMKEQGHTVTVFTGKPNYPDGDIYAGYSEKGVLVEYFDGDIPVYRVPLKPRKKGGAKNLTLNYLSFVFSGLKHAFFFAKNKQFDMILVFAVSPITAAIPAILLKWLTKAHLTIWVQDIWPESVEATGFIRNRFVLKLLGGLVNSIYYFSDTLLAQSKSFLPKIAPRTNKSKLYYYPNSVVDNFARPNKESSSLPNDLMHVLENHFCVVFAGNIGIAQAIETTVEAAQKLADMDDIRIVLVGSGSKTDWVKQQIIEKKINNIILAGRFASTEMPALFAKAQGLLVTLKKDEIFDYTIPSKIQSYLAAGKPIIAALDGEGASVIDEAGAGFTSPAQDSEKLANNIKALYHLPHSARKKMGQSGRRYFLTHFDMERQSRRLIEIFEDRLRAKGEKV